MNWNFLFFMNSALLGVGLAMDAFSVSLANGMNEKKMKKSRMAYIAGVYAFFQFLMPMVGWICVHTIVQLFAQFQKCIPWIALILLLYIGGSMIWESVKGEEEIEEVMDSGKLDALTAVSDKIGVSENREDLLEEYVYFFRKNFEEELENLDKANFTVAIDTANGATSVVADKVFTKLGINHYIINNHPNGININDNCGSTHIEGLQKFVVEHKCNLGIAYDGDGDRCLAVDEKGELIDGDRIMAVISNYLKEKGKLNKNTLVATVMSNLGLRKYAESNDIHFEATKVGDRYVLENMLANGYNLGGEQSGHIILLDYNPTGDGILTSLMLIKIMLEKGLAISKLCDIIRIYPQVLINAKVNSDKKYDFDKDPEIKSEIEKLEKEFSGNGRVLIRPSGTEPLVRVMIEGEDQGYIKTKAEALAKLIEQKLK